MVRVGDNDEVEVSEELIASVGKYAFKRARMDLEDIASGKDTDPPWEKTFGVLARSLIIETVHQLAQEATCFCSWHRSTAESADGVTCQICSKPIAEHERPACCTFSDDDDAESSDAESSGPVV